MIDAGDIEQVIEGQFFFAKLRDLPDVAGAMTKVVSPRNSILSWSFDPKCFAERDEQFRAGHWEVMSDK